MARLVMKDNITSGGALAPGQTLRLGGFTMTVCSARRPDRRSSKTCLAGEFGRQPKLL